MISFWLLWRYGFGVLTSRLLLVVVFGLGVLLCLFLVIHVDGWFWVAGW